MYTVLLGLHSICRWLVLLMLVAATIRAFAGWLGGRSFTTADNRLRHGTVNIVHLQFTLGLVLYFVSPITAYFRQHFSEAVHERAIRFFGMEHASMMLVAVILVTIGAAKAKRQEESRAKFKTMAIFFAIALLIILANIPWSFSPLVSRPLFRWPW